MAIKITALMTAFKFRKTDEEKEKMIKEHILHEYIPYEKKIAVAKAIADASYWRTEKTPDGKENKYLYIDSTAKYMLTCMSVVKLFTNIECQQGDGKVLEDFNTLNSSGILDIIIQNVDEKELKEFRMILDMICGDIINNEFENHAFISKQVNRFGELIGTALMPIISQLDLDKIKEIVNEVK